MRVNSVNMFSNVCSVEQKSSNQSNHKVITPVFYGIDSFAKNAEPLTDVLNIFGKKVEEMHYGLNLKLSPITNHILKFSAPLKNGNMLEVSKVGQIKHSQNFLYALFKEYKGDTLLNTVGVDMNTHAVLKLDNKRKAKLVGDQFLKMQTGTPAYKSAKNKLHYYTQQILKNDVQDSNNHEKNISVEFLEQKQAKKSHKLKMMDLEDLLETSDDILLSDRDFARQIVCESKMLDDPNELTLVKKEIDEKDELKYLRKK